MSKKNTSDSYEVGYGKPPRNTQFRKGASGNPKGRPKKTLDFDHELLRESRSFITINENGSRRRISKYEAVIKQLAIKAIGGNMPAARIFIDLCQIASEKVALQEASQSSDPKKYDDASSMTDEELDKFLVDCRKAREQEREK